MNPLIEKEPLEEKENSLVLMDQKELWSDLKETEYIVFVVQKTNHSYLPSETVPMPITKLIAKFNYISIAPTTIPPMQIFSIIKLTLFLELFCQIYHIIE